MANEFSAHVGLGALFVERGDACPAAARRPVSLCGAGNVWLVEEGVIDVLAARHDSGQMVSAYKHFVRLEIGRLAFSVNESNHGMRLVAKGLPGSKLRRLTHECLFDALAEGDDADAIRAEFDRHVDFWIESLSSAVSREMEGIPATELRLRPGSMTGSGVASPGHGVVWLATGGIEAGFLDLADTGGQELVPVSRDAWIRLHGEEAFECRTTAELDARRLLNEGLPGFHKILFEVESLGQRLLLVDEANLQAAQATRRRDDKARARTSLEALYSPGLTTAKDGPAMAEALRMIGRREGFDVRVPAVVGGDEPSLDSICDASMLRKRKVRLKATEQWWFGDSGAMLAIRREDGQSLALLPGMAGRYRVANPSTGDSRLADGRTATSFREVHCLYPGLSDSRADGTAGLRSLFRAGCCGVAGDVAILVATGIVAGTLALTPAFAVNWLATAAALGGKAVPALQLAAILAGTGALVALLHILRGTALMRVEGRVAARLSALVWDRLLRLGAGFFRGQTAGELSARSLVFQDVRDRVAGVTADGVLSTLFLLPALGLLFLYDAWLGWSATMIYVTHDQVEAMTLADRIVVLEAGTISQVGPPRELYRRPQNLFVAQFIGSPKMNVVPCAVEAGYYRLEGAHGGAFKGEGDPTHLGIRPEHITLCDPGDGQCAGWIDVIEYLGADTFFLVDCGHLGALTVRVPGDAGLAYGTNVGLAFAQEHCHFFDANGHRLDL